MAIYRVQGPDGAIYKIEGPDGASNEEIQAYAQQNLSTPQGRAEIKRNEKNELIPAIKDVAKAGWSGFSQGVMDTTGGITQAIAHSAAGVFPGLKDSVNEYDQIIRDRENAFKENTKDYPTIGAATRIGGNVASTLPITSLKVAKGAGMIPRIVNNAAQGAIFGGIQPVTNPDENFLAQKAKQAGVAAGTSAAITPVASGLSRIINPNVNPNVRTLLDAGVTPTPGQILGGAFANTEDKLTAVPLLGDAIKFGQKRGLEEFNKAVLNRALESTGQKSNSIGRKGVEEVSDKLGAKYSTLLSQIGYKPDAQFNTEFSNILNMTAKLPAKQKSQFDRIIDDSLLNKSTPQGNMSGESFKAVESDISNEVRRLKGSADYDDRKLGEALSETLTSLRNNLARQNPAQADELSKINQGYANYTRIRDAAGKQGAVEGVFTPSQLQAAVRAADKSAGKGDFAKGNALLQDLSDAGVDVLSPKIPDSGTTARGLASAATLGGAYAVNPAIPLSLAGASIPYAPGGRQLAAALLAKRPDIAGPIAEGVRSGLPAASPGIAAIMARYFAENGNQ